MNIFKRFALSCSKAATEFEERSKGGIVPSKPWPRPLYNWDDLESMNMEELKKLKAEALERIDNQRKEKDQLIRDVLFLTSEAVL